MEGNKVLATTPDLICLFDANTGEPVTTEAMNADAPEDKPAPAMPDMGAGMGGMGGMGGMM